MKKILFLLVLIYSFGYSDTCVKTTVKRTIMSYSACHSNLETYSGTQCVYDELAGYTYWIHPFGEEVTCAVGGVPLLSPPEPIGNSLCSANADGVITCISNPDSNGGARCRPLFALNGSAWTCDTNTNIATMVNNSNGVTLDENGNDVPSCNAGLVQKGDTCVPQESADSCPSGTHSFTDAISGQKGCMPDYIPPTTDSGTGTSSGGGSGSGSSSGGSGTSTGGTGTTDSGSGTGSTGSTGGTGTTDSGSGSGSGTGSGGSGTSGGGSTGTPTDSGTGTPTDTGTGTPTDTTTTPTNTNGNGNCSATGLTLQEKMLCELNQNQGTTNSKLGVANTKLTNIDENLSQVAKQYAELNKNLNNDIFSNNSFNDKLITAVNKTESLAVQAQTAMTNVGTGYQQMIGNLNTLQSFLQNKEDNSVTLNFAVSPPSCTNYNIFGHSKCLNCFFNIDMASLFVNIKPFISFLLNIVFVVLSIKMFMRYALSSVGVV